MKSNLELKKVLIVDDEPDLCELLKEIMEGHNLECHTAPNGKIALELLRNNNYQIVLCDIQMPQMNGLECLTHALAENILTPFVFVTGFGDANKLLQAIRLGAVDFISKPFDANEIAEVTFRVLEVGKRRQRISQSIKDIDPTLFANVTKDEKYISLIRAHNNKSRTG